MKPSRQDPTLAAFDAACLTAAKPVDSLKIDDVQAFREFSSLREFFNAHGAVVREKLMGIPDALRTLPRLYADAFGLLCAIYSEAPTLPEALQRDLLAFVTGEKLPAPATGNPLSPLELLAIAHKLQAYGETADAGRLRRLADDLVSKPCAPTAVIGWDAGAGDDTTVVTLGVRSADGGYWIVTVAAMVEACIPDAWAGDRLEVARRMREYIIGLAEGGAEG